MAQICVPIRKIYDFACASYIHDAIISICEKGQHKSLRERPAVDHCPSVHTSSMPPKGKARAKARAKGKAKAKAKARARQEDHQEVERADEPDPERVAEGAVEVEVGEALVPDEREPEVEDEEEDQPEEEQLDDHQEEAHQAEDRQVVEQAS
jgi:hypothetical protein